MQPELFDCTMRKERCFLCNGFGRIQDCCGLDVCDCCGGKGYVELKECNNEDSKEKE